MLSRQTVTGIVRCLSASSQCSRVSSSCVGLKNQSSSIAASDNHHHSKKTCWIPLCQQVRLAGHSQFANRKHTKGAKDALKAKIGRNMNSSLRIAIREGGGSDPKFNSQLRRAVEKAKAADVPNNTIENAIKQAEKAKDTGQLITMEAKGPGNSFMVFEAYTDSVSRSRQYGHGIIKKCGGQMQKEGTVMHLFDRKGVFRVMIDENCPSDEDAATELAIEIEAEDVRKITEEDGVELMEFTCDKPDFANVKKNLEGKNMIITRAQLEYIPSSKVELDGTMLDYVGAMYDQLEEKCDVIRIYDNIVEKPSS